MQQTIKQVLIFVLITLLVIKVSGQEKKMRPVQVTFIYPIGSSGVNSKDFSNNFSLNLLAGVNGGVNGFEVGSILNYNEGTVKGFQVGGVTNITKGYSEGLGIGGAVNISIGNVKGVKIAPVNITKGKHLGLQLGPINYSKHLNGVQLGVLNITDSIDGVQFGVINITDSTDGISIGLINIVKNGYYAFELSFSESVFGKFSYKMGTKRFYTIFNVGLSAYKNKSIFSQGIGFGSLIEFNPLHALAIEIEGNNIVYNGSRKETNSLHILRFNYQYSFSENFSLSVGPTINYYITKEKVNEEYGTLYIPYSIYERVSANKKQSLWVGLNAGIIWKL